MLLTHFSGIQVTFTEVELVAITVTFCGGRISLAVVGNNQK